MRLSKWMPALIIALGLFATIAVSQTIAETGGGRPQMDTSEPIADAADLQFVRYCAWREDGKDLLLFGEGYSGPGGIYTLSIQRKELRKLHADILSVGEGWYCPSRHEAFCLVRSGKGREMRLVHVDIATGKQEPVFEPERGWQLKAPYTVSRDGNAVAITILATNPDASVNEQLLFVSRQDGGWADPRRVWGGADRMIDEFYCAPDSSAITWQGVNCYGAEIAQYVMQYPSCELKGPLPESAVWYLRGWSPDGNQIVYYDFDCDTRRSFVKAFNIKTTATRVLAALPSDISHDVLSEAKWSPDGRWIAYTARTDGGRNGHREELWLASSDGKMNTCIGRCFIPTPRAERFAGQNYEAAWQYLAWKPDSTGLAFARGNTVRFLTLPEELRSARPGAAAE